MENKYKLLHFINSHKKTVTSMDIQNALGFSRRSIINYVQQLNAESENLISSTNKGYTVNDAIKASQLLSSIADDFDFYGYEKRKQYLLAALLLHEKAITIQEMADELFVSYLTMNKDINRLRKELKEHRLYIKTKNEYLYIIGEKKDTQAYLMNMLSHEWEKSKFSLTAIQAFFAIANVAQIKQIVDQALAVFKFELDDFSLCNYVLHLAICVETSYEQAHLSPQQTINYDFPNEYLQLIHLIFEQLMRIHPQCTFMESQVAEASIFMLSRLGAQNNTLHTIKNMDQLLPLEVKQLASKIITSLYNNYGISLTDENFIMRFEYHLKNLVLRAKENVKVSVGPSSVKNDYPLLFIIANYVRHLIADETHLDISETETLYIALHIGSFLENKMQAATLTYDLVILNYLDFAQTITSQIQSSTEGISLHRIVSSYDEIENVDFIVTTLPEKVGIALPQIKINLFCKHQDINRIKALVDELRAQKETARLKQNFRQLLDERFFYAHHSFETSSDLIKFLCHDLYHEGYVDAGFIDEIFYHEAIVPTEINHMAIPHPLVDQGNHVHRSAIAVWINEQPVKWVNNHVNFVFMLALLPEDMPFFQDIFDILTAALHSKETESKLLPCANLNEFIDILLDHTIV